MKIDIIKHQSESDGKSTCPHAVVLAPDDVTVYTFPCVPDYDKKKVSVLFAMFVVVFFCNFLVTQVLFFYCSSLSTFIRKKSYLLC